MALHLDLGSVPLDAPGDDLIDLVERLMDLGLGSPLARLVACDSLPGLRQAKGAEAHGTGR